MPSTDRICPGFAGPSGRIGHGNFIPPMPALLFDVSSLFVRFRTSSLFRLPELPHYQRLTCRILFNIITLHNRVMLFLT